MIKKLLIGASALALTTTVAHADPKTVDLSNNHGSAINQPGFNTAINNAQADRSPSASNPTLSISNIFNIASEVFSTQDEAAVTANVSTYDGSALVNNINGLVDSAVKLNAEGNKSAIDQDGAFNDSDVNQAGGKRGWSVVDQNGTFNYADVTQIDSLSTTSGANATKNSAYISQLSYQPGSLSASNSKRNQATVTQTYTGTNSGDRNSAVVLQGSMTNNVTAGGIGHSHTGTVTQRGSGNEALIEQGVTTWNGALGVESGNTATIIQGKVGNEGRGNNAVIQQKSNAIAYTEQYGDTNQAYVLQVSNGAISNIKQDGDDNFAAVTQSGVGAFSRIGQFGNSNSAFVDQRGADTLSEIKQGSELSGSDKNYASVVQTVANAQSHISQQDGTATILNVTFGLGGGNEAYVTQSNAANSASIVTQTGLLNQSVVKQ